MLSYEDWGFGTDSARERAAVLSGRAEGSARSLNRRQRKQPDLDLPGRRRGAAGAKTRHGFIWASGMGCPANRTRYPLLSARTGPAVRETRPRRDSGPVKRLTPSQGPGPQARTPPCPSPHLANKEGSLFWIYFRQRQYFPNPLIFSPSRGLPGGPAPNLWRPSPSPTGRAPGQGE